MSAKSLKQLTIEHLRGSVLPFTLSFEKDKKLTIVYGENGSGKSTICDAFEFLGKGIVGSLENKGLGRTAKYWPSVGKQAADVCVTLECVGETCSARISRTAVVAAPPESRPHVEVLRRGQILALIEATAANRYAAIQRFIDVSGVETSEGSLRELIKGLKGSREVAIARVQENRDAINQFWQSAGSPPGGALNWAVRESGRDSLDFDTEIRALARLQAAYAKLVDYPASIADHEATLSSSVSANADAAKAVQEIIQTIAADAGEVITVLEAAQRFLGRNQAPDKCPLCESSEKVEGLSARIDLRLNSFAALRAAQATHRQANANLLQAQQQLETVKIAALRHVKEFSTTLSECQLPADVPVPADATKGHDDLSLWLDATAHLPAEWKTQEVTRQDKRQFLITLQSALKTYQDNVQAQRDLDVLIPNLESALSIVEEERRVFSDEVLAGIAHEVGLLYEEVHKGEGLDKISLQLDPDRRASLEIGASFGDELGAPPQAYFSESHLDTLGLCVFLALAAMDGAENTILVLDDVLASVDEPHVDRLIEMLHAQASKFRHCVITTHYGPWKHKLKWGWLKTGECQFVELARWTNQKGLTVIRTLPDVERLKLLLDEDAPDPQLVCAKAGYILEAALNFLTLLYECAVPRKSEDRYTIGDLLPNIKGKLRQNMRVDVLTCVNEGTATYETTSLGPIFDELSRIAEARNVFGCHFKSISFELLDEDALPFGRQVHNLMMVLTDPDNGWPKNSNSGEYWATTNQTRRLRPLRKP
jgi:energy-coupling factor transporter ATP-binding protein EcfA2